MKPTNMYVCILSVRLILESRYIRVHTAAFNNQNISNHYILHMGSVWSGYLKMWKIVHCQYRLFGFTSFIRF